MACSTTTRWELIWRLACFCPASRVHICFHLIGKHLLASPIMKEVYYYYGDYRPGIDLHIAL